MSTTIDERVVSMQFDNQHFEKNVQTSMKTLDKLKGSLDLAGASKGLENVDAAARGINFSPLSSAVESVGMKFSSLQVIAITALSNITNSAVNAGKRIVSSLTIDPVKMGFNEYELKMGSIQTIMASTGESLETVNQYLGELNEYSDKTIYSFQDMTSNIGKFTNAGVNLEDSVAAIKGVSNVAAVSGANANEASRAMYNFAQALSSGYVKLIDWKSIENANMATVEFKEHLLEAAAAQGTLTKTGDGMYKTLNGTVISATKNFNDSLQEQWMTSDVLIGTLKEYSDETTEIGKKAAQAATEVKTVGQLYDTLKESAQSGWAQTWEIIIGDFEEAKKLLARVNTVLGDMIGSAAEARNELLGDWKTLGGRDDLIEAIANAFKGLMDIMKPIKEAWRDIFPPLTAEKLAAFTAGLKELTSKFKLSDSTSDKLRRTFAGLFATLDIAKTLISAVVKAVGSLFGTFGDVGGGILSVTASIGDFLVHISEAIKYTGIFDKILLGIADVIRAAFSIFKAFAKFIGKKIGSPGMEAIHDLISRLAEKFNGVSEVAGAMKDVVVKAFESIGASIEGGILYKVLNTIWTVITKIASAFGKAFKAIGAAFKDAGIEGVLDFFKTLIAGGIGVGIFEIVKTFKGFAKQAGGFLDSIKEIFDGVGDCLKEYQNSIKAKVIRDIAESLLMMAAALVVLSLIDGEKLTFALGAITAMFFELMIGMNTITKSTKSVDSTANLLATASALKSIAKALLVMAIALKIVGSMNPEQVATGLGAIAGGILILAAAVKLMSGAKVGQSAKIITKLSRSIIILSAAILALSTMSWQEMAVGLISLAVGMGVMVAAVNLLPKGKKLTTASTSIVILASSMVILATAMKIFATMSWEEMGRGLVGVVGGLAVLVGAIYLLPKDVGLKSLGLVGLAASMILLAQAVKMLGSMSWEGIGKGMAAIGGAIVILAIGLNAMKGAIVGAAALVVATIALALMVPVLVTLGSLPWSAIIKGLVAIAGAFAVVGIAGALLASVAPVILVVAIAISLIGTAVLAAGIGLTAFGAGLSSLAAGLVALFSVIDVVAKGIVSLIEAIIVGVIRGLGNGIIALCEVIISATPKIGEALVVLVLELCDVLIQCIPTLADTILQLVVGLLDALVSYTPQIVNGLFDFVIALIDGLAARMPDLIASLVNLVMSIFQGTIDALKNVDPEVLVQGIAAVGLMAGVIAALAAISGLIPLAMAGVIGMGLVVAELGVMFAALGALAQIPGLQWLINEGGELMQSVGTAIGKFIGGIVGGVAEGISSALPQIGTDLSTFMKNIQPFIEGASMIDPSTLDGVKSLVGVILALTGANILESLTSWLTGGSSITKFGEDLAAFAPNFKAYADTIAGVDPAVVTASAAAAKSLAEMCQHIPNSGGVVSWFAGDNSITAFADELPTLATGLKGFADNVAGITPEEVTAAAEAAKTLAQMCQHIPNSGGVTSWFAGDNSISQFGDDLIQLGEGLKGFADHVSGITPEEVTAAAESAKILAEMTHHIPNSGGVGSWFAGDNSISKFGEDIKALGAGLKGFSDQVVGVNPDTVVAAASAAKALSDMTQTIPNSGGVVSWFAGDNSVSKFAADLVLLGAGLKGFADQVVGINAANVMAASLAAMSLADITNRIPNSGGVVSWFAGDNSISKFGEELPKLGKGLKGFSTSVEGINAENLIAAAGAAKALAEMTQHVPTEGGIKSWFTGETSIANFADKLPALGKGLKGFSTSVEGINTENLTAASNAAKAIAEMTGNTLGNVDKIPTLADNLKTLGSGMKSCFSNLGKITPESISNATKAVDAVEEVCTLDGGKAKSVADALNELIKSLQKLANIPSDLAAKFSDAMRECGKISTDALLEAVKSIEPDMKKTGENLMQAFVDGLKSKSSAVKQACESIAKSCTSAIKESKSEFTSAGSSLVDGFASGISANTYKSTAKARAMAVEAARAAREALDINSPSKVFRAIGYSVPEGFAMGIDKLSGMVSDSATSMANDSVNNVRDTISRIAEVINSDIDAQPTIRPVLDLSDVRSGANAIGGLFDSKSSIGVMSNVGVISSAMKKYNRNEGTTELASEISKLRKDLMGVERATYQINGITYDDGSNIAEAVKSLVRAARVERRL